MLWIFPATSQTFVVEELRALRDLGVHPRIFARHRPGDAVPRAEVLLDQAIWLDEDGAVRRLAANLGTAIRHPGAALGCLALACSTRSRWTVRNLWWALSLARALTDANVSYVHAQPAGDSAEVAMFAARITGIRWGVTVHAADLYGGRMLCRKLDDADLTVTVCHYNVEQVAERCPGHYKWLIKYAGVDADYFRLDEGRPARSGRRVLAVGRLNPKKGFDQLIRAMPAVRRRIPGATLTIIGEGAQRGRLMDQIQSLGLSSVVHLAGAAPPAEVRRALVDADVLVAPCTVSPWGDRDSMPVVVKEAMAMELPVVATDAFGIPEMVSPACGRLVPRDDVPALAAAIADVLELPPEERARMGRAGRDIVEQRFDERRGALLLAQALQQVSTGAPRPPTASDRE